MMMVGCSDDNWIVLLIVCNT